MLRLAIVLTCALPLGMQVFQGSTRAGEPVRLILDTDICSDCDDVLALAMIHALQTRGDCQLLAVTISAEDDQTGPFVDAMNHFYGRGSIPIGVVRPGTVQPGSKFVQLAQARKGDALAYPHDLMSSDDAPEAVAVLRQTLAAQPDHSVVVAVVGFSTNLARLLASPPDEISPLSGKELVERKVTLLSAMAGAFEPINGNARYCEYNVHRDVPACQQVVSEWPTPIVFSGFEIGIALPYPHESIEQDYDYVDRHPVAEAYIARNPPPHDRPTWDLTSVLYAVQPDRGYFDLSVPGTVTVEDDGFTRFEPTANGRHRYLILTPEQKPRVLEALVQLSSQPPCQTQP